MIFFHDFLGLGDNDWKIKPLIKVFPHGWGFGCFGPRVFGDPYKKVRALLDSGKPSMFRLQLHYSKTHKFPSEKYMRQEIPRWNELALLYPNVKFFISPCCEYVENDRDFIHEMMTLTQNLAPDCGVVQSPGRKSKDAPLSPTFPDWYVEEHGNRARNDCDFFSPDGENAFDMCDQRDESKSIRDTRARLARCKYFGVWGARYNLLEAHNEYDSLHRIAPPDPAYVKGCAYLVNDWPEIPNPRFSFITPRKPWLLKTFAEDQQGEGDKRGNRPMFMVPKRKNPAPFVDMVTWDGQRVARFNLFKDTNPQRQTDRYYFDKKYAWQLAEKAIKLSGSPIVAMKLELTHVWPFHAAFRDPFFQVPK